MHIWWFSHSTTLRREVVSVFLALRHTTLQGEVASFLQVLLRHPILVAGEVLV